MLNSILSILVVFAILAVLYGIVRIFSRGDEPTQTVAVAAPVASPVSTAPVDDFSAGELKLINVDEKTAAMVMAIVSDESGIPLSELCFKSIKEILK